MTISLHHQYIDKDQIGSPILSPGNRRRKDVGDYWLGKTLGRGSSGRVKMGIHKVTGEKVAIKIISKSHLATNESVERAVKREIAVMKLISHPNIMSLLDVIDLSNSPNLYLVLEYVQGGELFDHLVSQGRLCEQEARKYFQQIILALDYCHRHLICHRDLKPENLLLDNNKNIKIADFGMASIQPAGAMLETSCGSPHYASPEIVNGIPYDGSSSDIWSCGIILFALLSGHLPFDDDNIRLLLNKVKVGKYKIPTHVSKEAADLIQKILVVNPKQRLTMQQVQQHPWFTADPPPNPTTLPDPPTATEIGRPVSSRDEIDDRILETLKVLWTDLSAENVIEALLNSEYNMQKVTYVLLQRHADSYWQTERDDDARSVYSPAKRRRPATICAVPGNKEPIQGLNEIMLKINEKVLNTPQVTNKRQFFQEKKKKQTDSPPPPPLPPKPKIIRAHPMLPLWQSPLQKRSQQHQQWYSPQPQHYFPTHNPYITPLFHPDISHMLSPRAPIKSIMQKNNRQDSKLNRFINVLKHQNHRVDPTVRLSNPTTFEHKCTTPQQIKMESKPSINSPLMSWLPGLFHFKQPKVCSLDCEARDEREAIGKISQVLKEYLDGMIIERQDPDGRIKRRGELILPNSIKPILLRFKLEIYQLETNERRIYRINFIQQQGDAVNLISAVNLIDQTLQMYEKEAQLVATANGWTNQTCVK